MGGNVDGYLEMPNLHEDFIQLVFGMVVLPLIITSSLETSAPLLAICAKPSVSPKNYFDIAVHQHVPSRDATDPATPFGIATRFLPLGVPSLDLSLQHLRLILALNAFTKTSRHCLFCHLSAPNIKLNFLSNELCSEGFPGRAVKKCR